MSRVSQESRQAGLLRAAALNRSARCPRFILPSRRRRRQKMEFATALQVCPKHLTFNLLSIKIEGSLRCFYFNMYFSHDTTI